MSAPTLQLAIVIRRFTASYQAALLRKAGVLAVLGGAILGLLVWRLSDLPRAPRWSLGAICAAGVVAAVALGWWLRRRWISDRSGAAYLDRTLGLQQRLITAEEFARADPPPALYPLLMDDASSRTAVGGATLPTPFDRTAAILAVILLLVLAWPLGARSPLQQLASLQKLLRPPEPPPRVPPPEPTPDSRQQQSSQSQQPSQSGGGGPDQPQPSGGGQQQSQPSPRDGSDQQSQSNASGQQGQSGSSQQQQQSASGSQSGQQKSGQDQQRADQSGGQPQDEGQPPAQRADRPGGQQQAGEGKPGDGGQQDSAQRSGASQPQDGQAQQQAGQQQKDSGRQDGSGKPPSGASQTKSMSAARQGGEGGGMSAGDQEALKAEIRELLKEVSGELKELQQQLAAEQPNTPPSIGTQTDPELFESPMALDPATGRPVPLALRTDEAAVKDPRTGGGSGRPTGEVLSDAPQAQPEEAQLSEAPSEEQAAGRQVVPPEYRNVFDRLNREESL